jgi:predicted GH43/DUF377 family glycosyl hydrolase
MNPYSKRKEYRKATIVKDEHPPLDKLGFEVYTYDNRELGGIQREDDLGNAKFNGCIFEHNGMRFMSYRAYSERLDGRSNIFVTMLDGFDRINGLNPGETIELDLPKYKGDVRQYEDARFFEHKGDLYLSYVCVEYTQTWWACIHVVKLDKKFRVKQHFIPDYDGNYRNNTQKNWIFYSSKGQLKCIFNTKSHQILDFDDNFNVTGSSMYKNTLWDKGLMRGGTTPVEIGDDKWLAFFHSSVEHGQRKRRYSMTPYIFDDKKIISIGKTIYGSTENPIVDIREHNAWWNPIVIFPMGLIRDGTDYLVSVGVNDLYNSVIRLPEEWVMDQAPVKMYHSFKTRYFFWNRSNLLTKFSSYKILKVGGGGTQVVGSIDDPEQYAYIKENYGTMQWITKQDYKTLTE